jgi:hypothetical protein
MSSSTRALNEVGARRIGKGYEEETGETYSNGFRDSKVLRRQMRLLQKDFKGACE